MKNFRTLRLAMDFYDDCGGTKVPRHLKDQLMRASTSIAANLAEGAGRDTFADKRRFYFIAMGSCRECQALVRLAKIKNPRMLKTLDHLGGSLYRLCNWTP
jgi:four helix bundle protein